MLIGGCPSAEQWTAYQVGKLRPDEMDKLEAHLELCLACRAALERGGTVADALVAAVKATALRPADERGGHLPFAEESGCRRVVAKLANEGDQTTPYFPAEEDDGPLPRPLGRFKLLEVLGRGGMGVVYRAWDSEPPREVALKLMRPEAAGRPEARERFLHEARLLARVEHDHVMPIFNSGEIEGNLFIVMPLREGETLADRLKWERPSSPAVIRAVGRQAALGLAAAHEKGVIHRDVKPSNLWLEGKVDDKGKSPARVRVLDFGLARGLSADPLAAERTVPGTIGYVSPEQIQGAEVDARSDLFSLGVVLYEMAAGRPPFQGPDPGTLLRQVKEHHPPPPRQLNPAIPARLSALIMRLLAKEPANRPASARAAADELAALRLERWPPRWVLWVAAGVLVLLAVGVGWRLTHPMRPADDSGRSNPPYAERYQGRLDVLVERESEPGVWKLVRLDDPRALPLKPKDKFRVKAALAPPAYLYVVWVDPEHDITPVYPWDPKAGWGSRPATEEPVGELSLPPNRGDVYTAPKAKPGVATMVLFARATPLDVPDETVKGWFAGLPELPLPAGGEKAAVWFDNYLEVREPGRSRTFGVAETNDPFARWQGQLQKAIGDRAAFQAAVNFARTGGK